MDNIVIIGGGMAGLYLQNKLLKTNKYKSVVLLEKSKRLGGRVFTYNTKVNGTEYSMEAGAGRFSGNHRKLFNLINQYNLKDRVIKLGKGVDLYPRSRKLKNSKISKFLPYDFLDDIARKIKLTDDLKDITFRTWLKRNVGSTIMDFIIDTYPYKDVFKINAYDAIRLYKKDLNIKNNFYVLAGGLSQLVYKLEKENLKLGGIINTGTECKDVKKQNNIYNVITNKKKYNCGNVVFTCQKPALLNFKILTPVKDLVNSVRNANLCRFYFIFDTKKCAWFKNIKKSITDSRISYFIPINYETGLVMISYVDEHNATYLKKMEENNKSEFINFVLDECEKIFGIKDIPMPIWTKSFYWKHGVGDWKVGVDSKEVEKNIIKPMKNQNIYICGENYSRNYQCWIEGALETADKVFNKLK